MQKLGGGFGYTKIGLADAYNQIKLLKSFLGSVQFYGKFIPNLATMAETLYRLTKKISLWGWLVTHPTLELEQYCFIAIRMEEGNYSQIHKEALAIIYGLRKFYQHLYGRQFILVTDHKSLTALFGPKKGTPLLAANRLARWALWLNQFDYTIEYRKTADHGNADALSRLPSGRDIDFDREESGEDTDMVCASLQVKPFDSNILRQESGKDPVISSVMRYVREGWPLKHAEINEDVRKFQKLSDSLSICHGCLIYGTRVVIPQSLQPKILDLLHIGHFGMERMKQLARTAVYWPGVLKDEFFLITSSSRLIFRMDLETTSNIVIPGLNLLNPIAVDYDPVEGRLYWTDVDYEHIASAFLNGSDQKVIKDLESESVGKIMSPHSYASFTGFLSSIG
nr:hypothetical protein BaRGS_030950 [Batillaria attramentaria]